MFRHTDTQPSCLLLDARCSQPTAASSHCSSAQQVVKPVATCSFTTCNMLYCLAHANSLQIARAELHSLLLQLTSQQREYLSNLPHDKCIQLFRDLRKLISWVQQQQQSQQYRGQHCSLEQPSGVQQQQQSQQYRGQHCSLEQPSGLQQTGAGPVQQLSSFYLSQVCSRADGTHAAWMEIHWLCFAYALLYPAASCSALMTSATSPLCSQKLLNDGCSDCNKHCIYILNCFRLSSSCLLC